MKILIGGSPCTHWSIAQTKNRETEASGIGWELFLNYRIARDKYHPDYFLYENNKSMSPAIRAQITAELGVEPVLINSALVSAQNRQRLYWVGKREPDGTYSQVRVEQPEDKGILLRDILESGVCWREKGYALTASNHSATAEDMIARRQRNGVAEPVNITTGGKSQCLRASYYKDGIRNMVGNTVDRKTCVAEPIRIGTIENDAKKQDFDSQQYRVYSPDGKSVTLCGNGGGVGAKTGLYAVPISAENNYNLRDYGVEGQIGNEASVEEYLQALVTVFREVRRVLRPDGTLWVNVGDSYATKSGNQPPTNTRNSCGHTAKRVPQGYKKKDLIGIPWQLAFALRADGWYLRQDIIWQKPNCMPESVSDRCTKSHEYIFLLSKSERYYFDAAAISEPVTSAKGNARTFRGGGAYTGGRSHDNSAQVERESHGNSENKTGRRNKRSVWSVSTNGFRGAHFAVFPEKLIEPCIIAGCPEGGVVLDPFAGSGTTGVVAKRMGRGFVGCEINPSYVAMAAGRIAEVE